MAPNPNDKDTPPDDPLAFVARPTPRLRASVEHQRKVLSQGDFITFLGVVRSAFDKYCSKLREFAQGVQRANGLHRMLDASQKAIVGISITCKRGCSGCCHYEIEITRDEAEVLGTLVRGGVDIDLSRLAKQAGRERKGPEWRDVLQADNRCVFLGTDGACRIYESRPAACRRLLVTTPAEACTTPGQPVAPIEVLTTEILMSAALSIDGVSVASLSKLLTAELAIGAA